MCHPEALGGPFSRKNSALGVATFNEGSFSTLQDECGVQKTQDRCFSLSLLRELLQERAFVMPSPHPVWVPLMCG